MKRLSARGLAFLKARESCKLIAYPDDRGIWTVGWGTTGPNICRGVRWTQEQADTALLQKIGAVEQAVNQLVTIPINQNQFDALASFVYNVGDTNFRQSTLLRRLNALDFYSVNKEFKRWNKITLPGGRIVASPGLVNRRAMEAAYFAEQEPSL